jgi:flagellar hook-length control protein FliK
VPELSTLLSSPPVGLTPPLSLRVAPVALPGTVTFDLALGGLLAPMARAVAGDVRHEDAGDGKILPERAETDEAVPLWMPGGAMIGREIAAPFMMAPAPARSGAAPILVTGAIPQQFTPGPENQGVPPMRPEVPAAQQFAPTRQRQITAPVGAIATGIEALPAPSAPLASDGKTAVTVMAAISCPTRVIVMNASDGAFPAPNLLSAQAATSDGVTVPIPAAPLREQTETTARATPDTAPPAIAKPVTRPAASAMIPLSAPAGPTIQIVAPLAPNPGLSLPAFALLQSGATGVAAPLPSASTLPIAGMPEDVSVRPEVTATHAAPLLTTAGDSTRPESFAAPAAPVTPLASPTPASAAQTAGQLLAAAIASWTGDPVQPDSGSGTPIATMMVGPEQLRATVQAMAETDGAPLDLSRDNWTGKMIERIAVLRDSAEATDTRIRLAPENLGVLDVSIRRDGDRIHVHFNAENPATRQLLAEAAPRLAELAEARGIKLGQTGVDTGAGGQQGAPRQPAPQPPSRPASADARHANLSQSDERIA